ncbi:MAG: hypothetical protein JNM52_09450 [Betaproteobacteria bacterium]|nr:hypothetical protein [Betaproteobacteria bacterium]
MQHLIRALWLIVVYLTCVTASNAATDTYEYDALGRLIRWVDTAGRITEYRYDPVGNILEVKRTDPVVTAKPTIASVAPQSIRQGDSETITVSGANLMGASLALTTANPAFTLSNLQTSASQLTFTLAAADTAPVGPLSLTVTTAGGSATFVVAIDPILIDPNLSLLVTPAPLAIPADNTERNFIVRISSANNGTNTRARTISLAISNPAIALVSPASLMLPAGQNEITAKIRGLTNGDTSLTLTAPGLQPASVPVNVSADFAAANNAYAKPLGVAYGRYILAVSPASIVVGSPPQTLTITGGGLQGVTGITLTPPDGVTVSNVVASGDGSQVTATITVAGNAPTTPRRLTLVGPAAQYLPVQAGGDIISITTLPPVVTAIEPLFGVAGSNIPMTIYGNFFTAGSTVSINPPNNVSVGTPVIAADGKSLTTTLAIALNAVNGPRTLTVTNPTGGQSDATPNSANTFTIVNDILPPTGVIAPLQRVIRLPAPDSQTELASAFALGVVRTPAVVVPTELASALPVGVQRTPTVVVPSELAAALPMGVVRESMAPSEAAYTPPLGIAKSPTALAIEAPAIARGSSGTLTIAGVGLSGVNSVSVAPTADLTLGAPSVSADGATLTIPISVSATAATGVRSLQLSLKAGAAFVYFSPASASQFNLTIN